MGKWAQARKRGRGFPPAAGAFPFPPPVVGVDWSVNDNGEPGELDITFLFDRFPGADNVVVQYKRVSDVGAFVQAGPFVDSPSTISELDPLIDYEVQIAFCSGGTQVSAWSASQVVTPD